MRAALGQDVNALACHLLTLSSEKWADRIEQVFDQADAGDMHRQIQGRADPVLGDGTISSALRNCKKANERPHCDPVYARINEAIYGALAHRAEQRELRDGVVLEAAE